MQLSVMVEAQEGVTYAAQRDLARRAESNGLTGFFRSDHYRSVQGQAALGSTDAWAVLAGLARDTRTIRLGSLVSPVTFRPAGNLAKVVATVAELAGAGPDGASRVVLGMGTGWLEAEHVQHGFPFEDLGTRFRRLEEHLVAVTAFWDPAIEEVELDGEFVQVRAGRFLPTPHPRPRIVVGGRGLQRTPNLAARFADELNTVFADPTFCARQRSALDAQCEIVGRDPATIDFSLMTGCIIGRDEAEFRERAQALHARTGSGDFDRWLGDLGDAWVIGGPDRARARLDALADAGVVHVMLQHQQPEDLDMLDVAAGLLD
jgi:alkanesulfonate monooxygenase SsuD/methylene tetrahydromethanopterin reductase-like flavin-dependent oxidoreductase (luciferase family)